MSRHDMEFVSALTGPVGAEEPRFLHDIDTDRLVGAIVALSAELWVTRDRQARLERLLTQHGALAANALDDMKDTPAESLAVTKAAEQFSARILGELIRSSTPTSSVGRARRHTGDRASPEKLKA